MTKEAQFEALWVNWLWENQKETWVSGDLSKVKAVMWEAFKIGVS